MEKSLEFQKKYSDFKAAKAWFSENVESKNYPPTLFKADGVCACKLNWEKEVGSATTVTDYPNTDAPAKRSFYTITYTEKELGLKVELKVTEYPNYPVVEYESVLTNISDKNSPEITDFVAFDSILTDADKITLHTYKGAPYSADDYHPYETEMEDGATKRIESTSGKPTREALPNFNAENVAGKNGVITVLGWPGKWRADFTMKGTSLELVAGEYLTDFVLLPGEHFRSPIAVLMFYKGAYIDGQNLYRRWLYQHNVMRNQGVHDGPRMMVCIGDPYPGMKGNAKDDVLNINKMKENGLNKYIDEFCQDAGWYDCDDGWWKTGNWYPDPERYPEGMGVVGQAAHDAGMQYHVWFEPERVLTWRRETIDLRDCVMGYSNGEDGKHHYMSPYTIKRDETVLMNYSIPKAVDYTIEFVNRLLDEGKIDIYRQDFNIDPAPFWEGYDEHLTETMGIPRWGITEEKYTAGYMRLWQSIIERHPGMMIDSCASGGMRNDLATIRYSYPHSRTDWWNVLEHTQSHTYGAAQWFVVMGGTCPQFASASAIKEFDPYQWRSETVTSAGFGFNFINKITKEDIRKIKKVAAQWKAFSAYVMYDFYPLTPYSGSNEAIMAFQYNDPEDGKGMIVAYTRPEAKGTTTIRPVRLEKDASYTVHDEDGVIPDYTVSGAEFMKRGIKVKAEKKGTAPCFTYVKN